MTKPTTTTAPQQGGGTPTPPRSRRKNILTAGDWERIERDVRKSELTPDPAQLSWLEDAS